jgi:hypothetical protein
MSKNAEEFDNLLRQLGPPDQFILCEASKEDIENRFKTKDGEEPAEIGEEQQEELNAQEAAWAEGRGFFEAAYGEIAQTGRVQFIEMNTTDVKIPEMTRKLNSMFAPKIVLVNHEKRLSVDTACSNISIKYNMLYLSIYQLIREHIEGNTCWGAKLQKNRQAKEINLQFQ